MKSHTRPWISIGGLIILFGMLSAGIVIRLHGLAHQHIGWDELHAVDVALKKSFTSIFTYYQENDNSIPLTVYAKVLLKSGALNELNFRLPVLACGILLIFTPLLFYRKLGLGVTVAAVALSAFSPTMVYYTLVARPYAPAALFTTLALFCWYQWLQGKSRYWIGGFVILSGLAVFFHLFCLFAVSALLAIALLSCRSGSISFRAWFIALGLFGLILIVLIGPGFTSLLETRLVKIGEGVADTRFLFNAIMILVGFVPGAAFLLILCIILGALWLWRSRPILCAGLTAMVAAQIIGLCLTSPVHQSKAWVRYFFPVWPAALILCAVGIDTLQNAAVNAVKRFRRSAVIVGFFIVPFLLVFPFPKLRAYVLADTLPFWMFCWPLVFILGFALLEGVMLWLWRLGGRGGGNPNIKRLRAALSGTACAVTFVLLSPIDLYQMNVNSFRADPESLTPCHVRLKALPPAYQFIENDHAAGDVILEYPCARSFGCRLYKCYQQLHEKEVKMARMQPGVGQNRKVWYQNIINLQNPDEIVLCGARYLIVHCDPRSEYTTIGLNEKYKQQVPVCAAAKMELIEELFGPAVFHDSGLAVYSLAPRDSLNRR